MDVLELPKPVINFLRTMSSEKEKYLLTWDLYGDGNSVTLSLTWKLANDCNQNETETKPTNSSQKSNPNNNNNSNSNSNINNSNNYNNKSENQINNNRSVKKLNDLNIIPPPSAAYMIGNKTTTSDHKDTKNINYNKSDRFGTSSKTHVIKSKAKDHNYYKIDNNDYYNNQNNPKTSASISSCLYFPISSKKNSKADIYKKNKSIKKQSSDNRNKKRLNRKKSNSETNLNEDCSSSSESCEECKNYSSSPLFQNDFTYRIVDYNLKSPVYKYKNARSIQNLNTYKEEDDDNEEEDKVEKVLKKSPWIKNKDTQI